MNSFKFNLLLESVFSFDSEKIFCLSVLRVSLKSLMVIKELEADVILRFNLSFFLRRIRLHQF
jgi:hypothetical protein